MMRIAYADSPYPGQAKKHYGPDAREVNHRLLINHLDRRFDGWALSTSEPALRDLLVLCPDEARVAAWVKGWCSWKPNVHPKHAWEPVIYVPARSEQTTHDSVRDWVMANVTTGRSVSGANPDTFCFWLFGLLAAMPEDEFVDLFPGSGAVSDAWQSWSEQTRMAL